METKEWNAVLDRYLGENIMSSEDYDNLDEEQIIIIQTIKKALKRIKYKYDKKL